MKISNSFDFFKRHNRKVKNSFISKPTEIKKILTPHQSINKFSLPNMSSDSFASQQQSTAGSLQNGQITEFYFQKLIHIEYQLCLVVFVNLFLIIISSSITFPFLSDHNVLTQKGCLYFCLVCFIVECLLLGFRTVTVLQLQKQQKILYEKSTIFSSKKVNELQEQIFYYMAECLIMMIQPYPFFQSLSIITQNSYDLTQFELPINDLLTVISVLRSYVFIRAVLILTPYQNTRSNRLCKMYGCKADFSFSLKCMFKDNPLILIGVFFTISSMIFAFQIFLVERRAAILLINPSRMCNNYPNALWLVLMTITTVGYGDYFPHTAIGRIIILIVAIWGTFIVSMMVVVVGNTLTMQKNQKRTTVTINKLQVRKEIQKQAKKLLGYFILQKREEKYLKYIEKKLSQVQNPALSIILKAKQQKIQYKNKKYGSMCHRFEKSFSKLRKQVKNSEDIEDIEDGVSSHFLHVNSDIQILNKNQEKIICFIHEYLECNGKKKNEKQEQNQSNKPNQIDKNLQNDFKENSINIEVSETNQSNQQLS